MPFAAKIASRARTRRALAAFAVLVMVFGATAFAADSPRDPSVRSAHAMVVAETPEAAAAGVAILKRGGNAIDGAVAAALATGVTHPASCGLGGGGFMLIYLAGTGKFYALDYRETAPLKATSTMYLRDGKPDEELARNGALAIGVPGEIAGLDAALIRFGSMKFQQVAAPAVNLARSGFPLGTHLAAEISRMTPQISRNPGLASVFLKADGTAPKAGDLIFEKNLADTIVHLGDKPADKFYHGAFADSLASFIGAHGGIISAADLSAYQPVWAEPLHRAYQGDEVYVMPPPSSGGVVLEMLGMLEPGHLAGLGVNSPPYLARLIEVMREGFVDRDQYSDPAFVKVPIATLLSPGHINQARDRALHRGNPGPTPAAAHDHGTANLAVVDSAGNVVVLTTTINTVFGSKLMDPKTGIILNDEMDDFAVAPGVPNAYKLAGVGANEIAPGKRPLSSMTPTIVVKNGKPIMAVGGSGGPTIITGVLQVLVDVIDFHLGPRAAVDEPRIHEQASPPTVIIEQKMPLETRSALEQMGYKIRVVPMLGAVGAITIAPGNLRGAGDPRKGGLAAGY
ncbi:MAG: gamma-glutamyltransferase [Candidatus Binataceae bacterium]